jgi:hypothetical protein
MNFHRLVGGVTSVIPNMHVRYINKNSLVFFFCFFVFFGFLGEENLYSSSLPSQRFCLFFVTKVHPSSSSTYSRVPPKKTVL